MKKIIFIKTIELLVIDGIMLAFLTFKEGLTWDWILIYSGWLILNENQRANQEASRKLYYGKATLTWFEEIFEEYYFLSSCAIDPSVQPTL